MAKKSVTIIPVPSAGNIEAPELIEIKLIDHDVPNHRQVFDDAALRELAKTIEQDGLRQPIEVYEKGKGRYTLGFGERRLRAHKLLKRTHIAAFVRPAASSNHIRRAAAIENLQRADLSPVEEALACSDLVNALEEEWEASVHALEESPYSAPNFIEVAAGMIGRKVPWVAQRCTLIRLSAKVRQLLLDGRIYLGHALAIAQLTDASMQLQIANSVAGEKDDKTMMRPVEEAEYRVEHELRSLHNAPFVLHLPVAGKVACNECPDNAANQRSLFDFDKGTPAKPKCLNLACYRVKATSAQAAVRRAAEKVVMDKEKPADVTPEHIKPGAVTRYAKDNAWRFKQKKTAAKAGRVSEPVGSRPSASKDPTPKKLLNRAMSEWRNQASREIVDAVMGDCYRSGLILLMRDTDAFKKGEAAKAFELLGLTDKRKQADALLQMANGLGKKNYNVQDAVYDICDDAEEELVEILKIKMAPRPTLESVKQAAKGETVKEADDGDDEE